MSEKTLIQVYEGEENHRQIIDLLAQQFPDLSRKVIYLYYTKLLVVLGKIDMPNDQAKLEAQFDALWGKPIEPYTRSVKTIYENPKRPGESVSIGFKDGKLCIDVKQADAVGEGKDWAVEIDPNNLEDSKIKGSSDD